MLVSSSSTVVDCTKQEAFNYLDKPSNHKRFTLSLVESKLVDRRDDGRKIVDYTYSILGVKFKGSLEEIERDEPNKLVFEILGDIGGEISIKISESEQGTIIEYTG